MAQREVDGNVQAFWLMPLICCPIVRGMCGQDSPLAARESIRQEGKQWEKKDSAK